MGVIIHTKDPEIISFQFIAIISCLGYFSESNFKIDSYLDQNHMPLEQKISYQREKVSLRMYSAVNIEMGIH